MVTAPKKGDPKCFSMEDPLTGQKREACFSKAEADQPYIEVQEPVDSVAVSPSPAPDYQYSRYCSVVKGAKENAALSGLARQYDTVFALGKQVDEHTLDAAGDALGLQDSPHWKWWTVRGGLPLYGYSAWQELKKIKMPEQATVGSVAGTVGRGAKALTVDAYQNHKAFRMWLSIWASFSQILRGPDEIIDNIDFDAVHGKEWQGWQRAAAYWGIFGTTMAASLWAVNLDYSRTMIGTRISNRAQLAWTLWWLAYIGYQYGRVDQREGLRMEGKDPAKANYPWSWSWQYYNANRLNSAYTSWAADAVLWAEAPKVSKGLTSWVFQRFGHPGYKGLSFTDAEKAALLTDGERVVLEKGSRLEKAWAQAKRVGRIGKTVASTPSRSLYTAAWWGTNVVLVSIPLSRVEQYARAVTEGDTLKGVKLRPIFSSSLNYAFVNPLKWAGIDASGYGFYSSGMTFVVYPWDHCNEIQTAAHQLALTHLERYRQATTHADKKAEKGLFQRFFLQSAPVDRANDLAKYGDPSYGRLMDELLDANF